MVEKDYISIQPIQPDFLLFFQLCGKKSYHLFSDLSK